MTEKSKTNEFIYSIGRRKTSVATLRLYQAPGKSEINGHDVSKVYNKDYELSRLLKPFEVLSIDPKSFYFTVKVKGGGKYSQLDAIVLALSRCFTKLNPDYKSILKKNGLLTRDPREVERKKTGLKKSRKAEQYSKR